MVPEGEHEVADRRFRETEQLVRGPIAGQPRGAIKADDQFVSEMEHPKLAREGQTSGVPSGSLSDIPSDPRLNGRLERRLPIILVVRLAQAEPADSDKEERTYTDNISARGVRVFSRYAWQAGDKVMVTPLREGTSSGNVVYCQTLPDGRYGIGVKFQGDLVTWSAIRRYDGIEISSPAKSESSTGGSDVLPQDGSAVARDKSGIAKK